ncbi:hypothetical protein KPH14_011954 [Odynerus spinipes]|uniref:FAD dependent oxidoreductase domain-containing protein n=1 Tax=Odynerus spinipes TaxID=1348599 RepID=A0AAD9VKF6_9HYME|nr:hypothetical protein KPH14_011954 [Odynerus spinipes]
MSLANYFEKEDVNDVDVIIVGAGLTGLATAYNILRRKPTLDVLIVEGTDKAGGRVLSHGCSKYYYVSHLQNHVTRLLQTLNIKTCSRENANARRRLFFTKRGPVNKLPTYIAAEVRYFLQTIQENCLNSRFKTYTNDEITSELATTSVDQLLKKLLFLSYARSICSSLIYSTCGMRDLSKVSALWTLVMLNGAGGLIDRLKATTGDETRYFVQVVIIYS